MATYRNTTGEHLTVPTGKDTVSVPPGGTVEVHAPSFEFQRMVSDKKLKPIIRMIDIKVSDIVTVEDVGTRVPTFPVDIMSVQPMSAPAGAVLLGDLESSDRVFGPGHEIHRSDIIIDGTRVPAEAVESAPGPTDEIVAKSSLADPAGDGLEELLDHIEQ